LIIVVVVRGLQVPTLGVVLSKVPDRVDRGVWMEKARKVGRVLWVAPFDTVLDVPSGGTLR